MIIKTKLQTFASAIKEFEGWFPGSRSYRNNNPGNLKFAGQIGAIGADETGHAIFNNYDSGWQALLNQIKLAVSGNSAVYKTSDTLYDFFGKYAEGNSREYAEFVANKLGVSPNVQIKDLGV